MLVLDSPADLWTVTWDLLRIGYDVPVGWLAGGMMAWRTAALDIERLPQITVHELQRRLDAGEVDLLDVRQPGEWASGHVRGATFITGGELPRRLDEVPRTGRPLAVACGSGYRSSVSASLLDTHTELDVAQRARRDERMDGGRLPDDEGGLTWTTPSVTRRRGARPWTALSTSSLPPAAACAGSRASSTGSSP